MISVQMRFEARHSGRFFDKELSDSIISTLRLSRHVVKSIENKELFVVYQPKVSIKEKKLIGAEALVRWERNGKN